MKLSMPDLARDPFLIPFPSELREVEERYGALAEPAPAASGVRALGEGSRASYLSAVRIRPDPGPAPVTVHGRSAREEWDERVASIQKARGIPRDAAVRILARQDDALRLRLIDEARREQAAARDARRAGAAAWRAARGRR
jgi:hypothetical protein